MPAPSQILFLPGALGNTAFWQPVAQRLVHPAQKIHIGWPGFGGVPPDPAIQGMNDLVGMLIKRIDRPTALIAQSMGGVIAARVALARPHHITHLVLATTSGGMDMNALGAQDWRPAFLQENPSLPDWFARNDTDITPHLGALTMPTLLLWGDADPISPVAVGEKLLATLPNARLHVIKGGGHDVVSTHAVEVTPLIQAHLKQ